MKKSIVILLVIISIFVASCSPQVTVTSQVTVTLFPATQMPEPSATPTDVYTPTPAKDIITNPSGIGFELGAQIEGQPEGVRKVKDIIPPDAMDAKKKAEFETRIDPTTYGFLEGETGLVYIPTEDGKGRVELQRASNSADIIAVFGRMDFVWETEQMVDENGDPVFLNGGFIVDPANNALVRSFSARLYNDFLAYKQRSFPSGQYFTFTSQDGTRLVIVDFAHTDDTRTNGYLFYMDEDLKTIRAIYVEGFDESISFVEAVH